jgi:hypothetical protein
MAKDRKDDMKEGVNGVKEGVKGEVKEGQGEGGSASLG